jgi:hypothetical protein
MSLEIVHFEVAFMDLAKKASGLPHTVDWQSSKPSDKRVAILAATPCGSGHDKFLSGICVFVVVKANHAWWMQFMEYHFRWAVSSTSKMHTFPDAAEEDIEKLPIGYELTQAHVVNYRQLKTMYQQRKNHRLQSWKNFCAWIKTLPDSHLITGEQS